MDANGGPTMIVKGEEETSPDVRESVIVIDHAGQILRFSDGAEQTFGYSAAEVIGKNVRLLMPEPYRYGHDKYIADYVRTGEAHIIGIGRNVTATRKDGSNFPAQLSVTEIGIGETQAFVVGIVRDLTARVAAESESRARTLALDTASATMVELSTQREDAEVRYRLLADNAIDVVAHLRGREVVWISPSVELAFGWRREHWIGTDITSHRVHADDVDAVAAVLREVAHGESAATRLRVSTADGSYRWVEARGKPYIDGQGNTDGVIFATRLIDGQVAAEQQHKADRERFEAVVANAPSAISVRDLEMRYTLVNEAFCKMFGKKSIEDVIGRTEDEVLPPDVLKRSRHAVVRLLAEDKVIEEETISLGRETIFVMTQCFSLRNSVGAIAELVTIRTDITHRKRIEQAAAERATWHERIETAVSDGRLLVFSQPIVDIATRETVAEELLVRLRVVDAQETLSPHEFLPQCEKHGLMPAIDRYMAARAIDLARTGRRVSVNITGDTIGNATVMSEILEMLAAAGPAVTDKIMFEITETIALASPEMAKAFSLGMRNLGCRVALDDFGTGYGTFTELRVLDLDALKIDQSFVKDMFKDPDDERVVNTIAFVARTYGLTTVAEGVETEETLERLAELGIDRAQGYVFGEPTPILLGD